MGVWRRLLLAVVCGVAVASIYAAQPVLEPMGRDLGVPAQLTGWIVAVGQVGYLAGLVLLVPLGDVVDRRRLIAVHLALTALGMIVTASAPAAWVAFAGLAAAGRRGALVEEPVGGELAQAVREDVAGDAGASLELGERSCAVHRVADDEQAPPVADEVERARDRAGGVRPVDVLSARHDPSRSVAD